MTFESNLNVFERSCRNIAGRLRFIPLATFLASHLLRSFGCYVVNVSSTNWFRSQLWKFFEFVFTFYAYIDHICESNYLLGILEGMKVTCSKG